MNIQAEIVYSKENSIEPRDRVNYVFLKELKELVKPDCLGKVLDLMEQMDSFRRTIG